MTISSTPYEASNEVVTALSRQIDMWLQNASTVLRSAVSPTTLALDPIAALAFVQNFGIVSGPAAQRNFAVSVTITENDAGGTSAGSAAVGTFVLGTNTLG